MAIRIVQLGTPRARGEGLRIGTVRRPPRGVPKAEFASRDFYDTWLPELSPSDALVKLALQAQHDADEHTWHTFDKRFRAELARPEASRLLDLLTALSHQTNLAIGCYCKDESMCHRSILRAVLAARGATITG